MQYNAIIDLTHEKSPIPMIRTKELLDLLSSGDVLKVTVSMESAVKNIKTLISNNPYDLLKISQHQNRYELIIKKL